MIIFIMIVYGIIILPRAPVQVRDAYCVYEYKTRVYPIVLFKNAQKFYNSDNFFDFTQKYIYHTTSFNPLS